MSVTYFFLRATYEFNSLTCTNPQHHLRLENTLETIEQTRNWSTMDWRLSLSIRLVLASFPLSKLLTSLSKSLIRLQCKRTRHHHHHQIIKNRYKYEMGYLLQSRILSVSSSSCLLCLLASLIFSSFWNPFLVVPTKTQTLRTITRNEQMGKI